jgi:hypothetical protein
MAAASHDALAASNGPPTPPAPAAPTPAIDLDMVKLDRIVGVKEGAVGGVLGVPCRTSFTESGMA